MTEGERMELSEVLEYLKRIEGRVQSLDEAVRGNGKPGLNQEVASVRASLKACQDRRDILEAEKAKEEAKKWSRFIQPVLQLIYAGVAFLIVFGFAAWTQSNNQSDLEAKIQSAVTQAITEGIKEK